jgi:hypothetical protein
MCTPPMLVFVRERQSVNKRCSREHEELLRQTIFELAERLPGEDLRLTDFLRLLQLRDELEVDRKGPLRVVWAAR